MSFLVLCGFFIVLGFFTSIGWNLAMRFLAWSFGRSNSNER